MKVKRLGGKIAEVSPEYEACRKVARESGVALSEVIRRVTGEAERALQDRREP